MPDRIICILLCLFAIAAKGSLQARVISETEPNDETWQANPAACGDTVVCGSFGTRMDLDHFRFSPLGPDSMFLRTEFCAGDANTYMILYNTSDSILAVNDNSGPGHCSMIRYWSPGPVEYVLRVMQFEPVLDTTYTLTITCINPPPEDYDLCTTPRIAPSLPYYNEGSTYGATSQAGTPAPDVFYKFNNPAVANYVITVCSSTWDARVGLLSWCIGGEGDDASSGCGLGAALVTYSLPVGDYWVIVEGAAANQQGDFSIEIEASLPPCPAPQQVVITRLDGYPFLDWPELDGPTSYVIENSTSPDGVWEHLGISPFTYFVDSLGFGSSRKFYRVTSICPW